MLWGSTPVEGRGPREELINLNKGFRWPLGCVLELGWPSTIGLSWIEGLGIHLYPMLVSHWMSCSHCDLGRGSFLQLRQSPKKADGRGSSLGSTAESWGSSVSSLKMDLRGAPPHPPRGVRVKGKSSLPDQRVIWP